MAEFHDPPRCWTSILTLLNKSSPASMRYANSSTIHTSVVQTEMESGWSISAGLDIWDEGSLSSNLSLSEATPTQTTISTPSILVFFNIGSEASLLSNRI